MSDTPDVPRSTHSEPDSDDTAMFDELASRAGAALRRPPPADGMRVIAARRQRQRALKASALGGIAVATLIGALLIVDGGDDTNSLPPARTPTTTEAAAASRFASTVTAGRRPIDEWIDEENHCDHVECSFAIYVVERYERLPTLLRALRNHLEDLGEPPAEIADLVDRTSEGLDAAASHAESFLSCARTHQVLRVECGDAWEAAEREWRALPDLLAAWEPFG
jgi:hypothetical protein